MTSTQPASTDPAPSTPEALALALADRLLGELLGADCARIDQDADLVDHGLDSMRTLALADRLDDVGVEVDAGEIMAARTRTDLARLIARRLPA